MRKKKTFMCYLCEKQTLEKRKGLEIGSGKFTHAICKLCSRENYAIHEESYYKEHEEMMNEKIPRFFDEEEIILNQIKFMKMSKELLEQSWGFED
jgi:hypothetical protein|tara:strand:+ start:1348 stop:1632 length:285 start_codon:yes stop_codon:yes gene_type:complete